MNMFLKQSLGVQKGWNETEKHKESDMTVDLGKKENNPLKEQIL